MRALVILAVISGCVSTDTTRCEGGTRCPEGTECVQITFTDQEETTCVEPERRTSCAELDDGERCMVGTAPATCHDHVCFPDACANRLVDIGEACDDGNTFAGDGCSATCASDETCGNGLIDLVTSETCDDGGGLSNDGCSSSCAAEAPTWARLENARGEARTRSALVYDVARRRVVMFGGAAGFSRPLGDTREWDGRRWSRPIVAPEPLARYGHAMAYDAARGQIVMYGRDATQEMWLRDRDGTWSLITPLLRPPPYASPLMAYDAARQRVVLVGGIPGPGELVATWIWNGATWRELAATPAVPLARIDAMIAYDPKRGVVVMMGGRDYAGMTHDDLWELHDETWVNRTAAVRPTRRTEGAMAWDPVSERVLLVGGRLGGVVNKETWAWDGQTWTPLANAITTDLGLVTHAMATDTARGRIVLIGRRGDLQEWDGTRWTIVDTLAIPEPKLGPRWGVAAALDPVRREIVVFGGSEIPALILGETWIWNGTWREELGSPSPSPRDGATLVFDAARDEMVLFGGCGVAAAETWIWKAGSWTLRPTPSSPPPRCYHGAAYDAVRKKVVIFGGGPAVSGPNLGDTWTWDGTTWTDESPAVRPSDRQYTSMAYDPRSQQVVLFGGYNGDALGETWTWDGAWTQKMILSSPAPRFLTSMAWDAARQRLVLFGGNKVQGDTADVWEWDGATWTLIPTAQPPIGRGQHVLVPDLEGSGVLAIGGIQATLTPASGLDDVLRLVWNDGTLRERCIDVDTDGDGLILAADPDCWSTLAPLCPPATSCDPTVSRCGDGVCNLELESCSSCAMDCGACASGCGNFACEASETTASCPGDCGV